MMKKSLLFLTLVLCGIGIWSFTYTESNPNDEKLLMALVNKVLKENHYVDVKMDDVFSEKVYDLYISRMDYNKMYFLEKDIKAFESYKHKIDDEIMASDLTFYKEVNKTFDKRFEETEKFVFDILEMEFDFTIQENYQTDPEKRDFAKNEAELKEQWRKYIKYTVLNTYIGKLEKQETAISKGADSTGNEFEVKTEEELLEASVNAVTKNMKTRFERRNEIDEEDNFSFFINAILGAYDPHTSYFPPQEKENFDMRMTGRLEGIGAVLQEADGYIKINSIVTGSACWKQGDLEAGDLILKVAQGDGEPEDIVDAPMKEVLKLIRGPKGTEVRLTVQKADGDIMIIPIVRDVVIREETYAKSAVIEDKATSKKYGYLYLPGFYAKFGQKEGRSSAEDVDDELMKLKKAGVEGIIFDLRDNGGGSLPDAVEMTGLFIKDGPVVQVKSNGERPYVKSDYNSGITYDGPLIIMTSSFSASASEIVSAALQDYNRALIVGSPTTYGKGTVQTFMDLNRFVKPGAQVEEPFGSLKFTIQQFYRVNGSSTQFRGVRADIDLPDIYDIDEVGEKSMENAIPWDSVPTLSYTMWNDQKVDVKYLKEKSKARRNDETYFRLINQKIADFQSEKDKTEISLVFADLKAERDERKAENKALKDAKMINEDLIIKSLQEINIEGDTVAIERISNWEKEISKDIYLHETLDIMNDFILTSPVPVLADEDKLDY